jgi:hypothetical protein
MNPDVSLYVFQYNSKYMTMLYALWSSVLFFIFAKIKKKHPFGMTQVRVYLAIQLGWTALEELPLFKITLILDRTLRLSD